MTETNEMSTGNSANKLWHRRDLIKLLGAAKHLLVAGQWRKRDNGFELVICEDATAPTIKAQEKLRLLS